MVYVKDLNKEKLIEEIFDYFNKNPNSSFVDISKGISSTCTPNKVRRLLLSISDRKLDNGLTVEEQLDLKKIDQKKFLDYVYSSTNISLMDIVNNTGISIDKVSKYFIKYKDFVLCNGKTLEEQRKINKENQDNELLLKKKKVVDYFINNPFSTFKDMERELSINSISIKEYLLEFSDLVIPSTCRKIVDQITYNKNKYNDLRKLIIEYYNNNPSSTFIEIAQVFNCSKSFVHDVMSKNFDYLLDNDLTVKEQVLVNNPSVDELLIVDTFKLNPTLSLRRLAHVIDSDLDSVRNYLYRHVDEVLDNGLTIGEQLDYNKRELRHLNEDTIPHSGVFIRNRNSFYRCLVTEIDGMKLELFDNNGNKIGTINVSSDFEEKIVKEFLNFYLKGCSLKEFILENDINVNSFNDNFNRINNISTKLYEVINSKIKSNRLDFIGPVNFYDIDQINEIIFFMINNNLDYESITNYYPIDSDTLKELVKRGDKQLFSKLDSMLIDKKKNSR